MKKSISFILVGAAVAAPVSSEAWVSYCRAGGWGHVGYAHVGWGGACWHRGWGCAGVSTGTAVAAGVAGLAAGAMVGSAVARRLCACRLGRRMLASRLGLRRGQHRYGGGCRRGRTCCGGDGRLGGGTSVMRMSAGAAHAGIAAGVAPGSAPV